MDRDKSVEEACATVLSLGMDGMEHLIALRNQERILCKRGDDHSVSLGIEIDSGLLQGIETIVHNHPDLSTLSGPDLSVAQSLGCEIVAVTADGSRYSARILAANIYHTREFYWTTLIRPFQNALREFKCTESEATLGLGHAVNLVLHATRSIEYNYTVKEPTQRILEKLRGLNLI